MKQISFISTGSTVSQTPVMASISYNLVNSWVKEASRDPDFPVACIYDFSNMYSTLQFFATDKMLTRLNELTSLVDVLKETKGINFDWSVCTFPSKFAHKKSKNPLFFIVPIFPRGMTSDLRKDDIIELAKLLQHIAEAIEKAKCQYIFYDLPLIDSMGSNLTVIPALINSDYVICVIDCKKPTFQALENELSSLQSFITKTSEKTVPGLIINGIILTNINEKVKSDKWIERLQQLTNIPIVGQIREDAYFTTVSSKYEIPTEEQHAGKLKYYNDFKLITDSLKELLNEESNIRKLQRNQVTTLEETIYSI